MESMKSSQDVITFWLNAAGKYPLLPREEIIRLGNLIQDLDVSHTVRTRAVRKLVRHNLRLIPRSVRNIILSKKTFNFGDNHTEDLLQAAVIGLTRAAEKYDPKTGYAFSTYANMWIFQAVQREICGIMSNIRVPENTLRELYKSFDTDDRAFMFTGKTQAQKDRLLDAWKALHITGMDDPLFDRWDKDGDQVSGDSRRLKSLNGTEHGVKYEDGNSAYEDLVSKASLNKRQREILYLTFVEDQSASAVAVRLGICTDTVKRNLNISLDALKQVAAS